MDWFKLGFRMQKVKKNVYYSSESGKKVTKRHLPHWQQNGKIYFVTFRLADSIPLEKLDKLRERQDEFIRQNVRPYTSELEREYQSLFFEKVNSWLDNCYGECVLASLEAADVVKSSLEYYDGDRYLLDYWVIMPNHVHVIILLKEGEDLDSITHSWKSYSANKINKLTGNSGQLWQHESFDHIVRDKYYLAKYRKYIVSNKSSVGSRAMLSKANIVGLE